MKNIGLKTVVSALLFFGFTYMLLVFTNRSGNIPYLIAGLILLFVGIVLFILSQKDAENHFRSNLFAIMSGVALWGFFGEFLENADMYIKGATLEIAHWNYLPVLIFVIFVFLNVRRRLSVPVQFSLSSFLMIWSMHYVMIFQYEALSRTHFTTYIMCGVFLLLTALAVYKARKSEQIHSIMFWSYFGLLTAWSVLEYVWGWRLIPGPYSI
ncbi:MAG: hypothetical protein K8R90_10775 [Candidatus Cloacimonetes bacterium]|nr:hypothetical protein [Candidatus Cloacimonadota bacterium]